MSKPANKTMIGIFVVAAIGLIVAAIVLLGSGKFFTDKPKFVMYFEGSVKGLSVGSPVVFRGVKIGSVTEIGMRFNPTDLSVLIPVYVELGDADIEMVDGGDVSVKKRDRKKVLYSLSDALIKRGARAQLEMQSFVTGQLQIAIDFYPNKPAKFVGGPSKYPELPTIPTQLQELTKRIEQLPIEEIGRKLQSTLNGMDRMINSPEISLMIKSIGAASDETKTLVRDLDRQLEPLVGSITQTSNEAGVTLKRIQAVSQNFGDDSVFIYKLDKTLDELQRASRSLRLLTETLEQHPESLIFGKKNTGRGTK